MIILPRLDSLYSKKNRISIVFLRNYVLFVKTFQTADFHLALWAGKAYNNKNIIL